jgi:hypothetical protein
MEDSDAFGPWFEGDSWASWRALLRAAYALPMSDADRHVLPPWRAAVSLLDTV